MLVLYHAWESPFSARVRLVLAEKSVVYRSEVVSEHDRSPYLLEEDGFILPCATAICEYVDEVYPGPTLMPVEARGRALVRSYIGLCDLELAKPVEILKHSTHPERVVRARERLRKVLISDGGAARLEPRGPYLLGEFGMADLCLAPWVIWIENSELLADLVSPQFRAWVGRLRARSSVMTDPFFLRGIRYGVPRAA
ncbi:MAG: glutathione S-transferase family protein [Oligoflexia bacterium]|nr:glutathione S-transferase family protein [Oligoflexia bacterium]